MENNKIINEIYSNLQNKKVYGRMFTNVKYPFFDIVLYKTLGNYIGWHSYGSSANKNTKEDLKWIIETIFRLTPKEFIKRYECRSVEDI